MKTKGITIKHLDYDPDNECEIYDCADSAIFEIWFNAKSKCSDNVDRHIKLCPTCLSKLGIKVIKALR